MWKQPLNVYNILYKLKLFFLLDLNFKFIMSSCKAVPHILFTIPFRVLDFFKEFHSFQYFDKKVETFVGRVVNIVRLPKSAICLL